MSGVQPVGPLGTFCCPHPDCFGTGRVTSVHRDGVYGCKCGAAILRVFSRTVAFGGQERCVRLATPEEKAQWQAEADSSRED